MNLDLIRGAGFIAGTILAGFRTIKPRRVIKSSTWFAPYKNGRPALPSKYYNRPGVYAIKSRKTGKIIYIGYSATSLKKTLYRHFQTWNDTAQNRYTYDPAKYLVKIFQAGKRTAPRLEKALIKRYNPRDNKLKYPSLFEQNPAIYKEFFRQYTTNETPF
jgi:excinuclease UvrABC nuclease subunit